MKCIVAAVDLGPATEAVLAAACDLARAFSLPIHLVNVVEQHKPEKAEHALSTQREDRAQDLRRHERDLQSLLLRLREQGYTADLRKVTGDTASLICEEAETHQARYIVLGAREPSALRHLVARSVPAEVMRCAVAPVVFVGPWQRIREFD